MAVHYTERVVDREIGILSHEIAALSIEGAKAVGKTSTALRIARTVHRLDDEAARAVAAADPSRLLQGATPILIDEWQRLPSSWDLVRRAVDERSPGPGSFILTGSASPHADAPIHSGAGRIVTVRMRPMSLAERNLQPPAVGLGELLSGERPTVAGETPLRIADYAHEITASGFPGLRGLRGRALRAQLDGYVDRIVEREIPALGVATRNPAALRRWLAAYAAASSTTASFEAIRDAATGGTDEKPAKATVRPYRDALERLWVLDPVPAWLPTRNRLRRLAAAPKHQLVDPALAARLLGVDAAALLDASTSGSARHRDAPLLGALFEALVTLDVRVYAQASEARVGHLRTAGGEREVDLIVERADGRVVAIEVKMTGSVDDADVRHLRWLRERLGDDLLDAVVITCGPAAYRRPDGVAVIPAGLLGP